jgi:high-affinity iron transporter
VQINAQLDAALKSYAAGDASTANSDVSTAYNTGYIASNFVMVTRDTLGADRQQAQAAQFQSIQQLTYAAGHDADLQAQITALQGELTGGANTLDATQGLANPRDYAATRAKTIQQQRKKLQSEKKGVFNGKGNRSWAQVAKEMGTVLDSAVQQARSGDKRAGVNKVNEAYYQYYKKLGFEKNVMNAISGSRVSLIENQFAETRKSILDGDPISHTTGLVNQLKSMLGEDAAKLDGGSANQGNGFTRFVTSAFGQAFVILIREGLEALLVVTAIIAYLVKSGNRRLVTWIYVGVVAGLIGSGIVAVLFGLLFSGSGPQQEIMEGVVALIAMGMLLYTSNWMLSKSSVEAWNSYITSKAHAAVDSVTSQQHMTFGGVISLAMLSFLAVFREGAETVMFYQSIYSMSRDSAGMWAGGLSAADSNLHLEADIHALKNNELGYGTGEFIPKLTVKYKIEDKNDASNTQEGTFMEMNADDGPHYGANLKLDKAGQYKLTFTILSPQTNGWTLHVDPDTGVKGRFWTEPITATFDWDYTVHQW